MAVKRKLAAEKTSKRAKGSVKTAKKTTKSAGASAQLRKPQPRVRLSAVRKAASQPRIAQAKSTGKSGRSAVNAKPSVLKSANGIATGVNGKSQHVEAKLTRNDLEHFRELLLEKRREILGDVGSMESEAFKNQDNHSSSPMHMADVGTDNFEQEFTLGLIESERQMLREIHEAIGRIEDGTYGVCAGTGQQISRARLEATPWAKYCIEYARMLESGLVGRESTGDTGGRDSSDEDED